jgi:hypothetical protein
MLLKASDFLLAPGSAFSGLPGASRKSEAFSSIAYGSRSMDSTTPNRTQQQAVDAATHYEDVRKAGDLLKVEKVAEDGTTLAEQVVDPKSGAVLASTITHHPQTTAQDVNSDGHGVVLPSPMEDGPGLHGGKNGPAVRGQEDSSKGLPGPGQAQVGGLDASALLNEGAAGEDAAHGIVTPMTDVVSTVAEQVPETLASIDDKLRDAAAEHVISS